MGRLREVPKIRDGLLNDGTASAELDDALTVDERDIIVNTPRFGAFYGTDLELILRSRGIDTVIISGMSTPVCCDKTAREANARDIRVVFLSDGTATTGDEADRFQQAAIEALDGLFADIATIDEVLKAIGAPAA